PEVLGAGQKRVLRQLGPPVTRRQFYLAGGTALAAQIGHRRSVDLDWFTGEHLADPLLLCQRKYSVADIAHVLYGLAYFDDAEKERMPSMLWSVDWRTIKRTIQQWVRQAAR